MTAVTPRVSFEFFPPKSDAMAARLWETVQRLEPMQPAFVSVTYGAGGSTRERTHETVKRIAQETSLKPAGHLTCVSATRKTSSPSPTSTGKRASGTSSPCAATRRLAWVRNSKSSPAASAMPSTS